MAVRELPPVPGEPGDDERIERFVDSPAGVDRSRTCRSLHFEGCGS